MNYDPNTGQPIYNGQQPVQPQQSNSTNGFAIAGLIVSIFFSAIIGLITLGIFILLTIIVLIYFNSKFRC